MNSISYHRPLTCTETLLTSWLVDIFNSGHTSREDGHVWTAFNLSTIGYILEQYLKSSRKKLAQTENCETELNGCYNERNERNGCYNKTSWAYEVSQNYMSLI